MLRIDDPTWEQAVSMAQAIATAMAADLVDATADLSDADAVALTLIGRGWSSRNVALHMDAAVRLARKSLDPQN